MHSIEKFDPEKGFRISTYSAIWIREYIERAIMNMGRTIRLPVHLIKEMNRYLKAGEVIAKEMGRKATEQEIASAVKKPVEKVREVLGYYKDATSLNIAISSNSNKELEDLLPDNTVERPDHSIQETTVNEKLNRVFVRLDPQEQEVIRRRFALGSCNDYQTLEAVSEAMGISKEIVRKIQLKALSKLKTYLSEESLRMEDIF
jgi:RNA polymerase nonessential primary-like sigma factor